MTPILVVQYQGDGQTHTLQFDGEHIRDAGPAIAAVLTTVGVGRIPEPVVQPVSDSPRDAEGSLGKTSGTCQYTAQPLPDGSHRVVIVLEAETHDPDALLRRYTEVFGVAAVAVSTDPPRRQLPAPTDEDEGASRPEVGPVPFRELGFTQQCQLVVDLYVTRSMQQVGDLIGLSAAQVNRFLRDAKEASIQPTPPKHWAKSVLQALTRVAKREAGRDLYARYVTAAVNVELPTSERVKDWRLLVDVATTRGLAQVGTKGTDRVFRFPAANVIALRAVTNE